MPNQLNENDRLNIGQRIESPQRRYFLELQGDGNLVLYENWVGGKAIWKSNTAGKPSKYAVMQKDGNFVIYGDKGAIWATNTNMYKGTYLRLDDDGDLVIFEGVKDVWGSGTNVIGAQPQGFVTKQIGPEGWTTLEVAAGVKCKAVFVRPAGAKVRINLWAFSIEEQELDGVLGKALVTSIGRIQARHRRKINISYSWNPA